MENDICVPSRRKRNANGCSLIRRITASPISMSEAVEVITEIVTAQTPIANHDAETTIRIMKISDKPSIMKTGTVLSEMKKVAMIPKMELSDGEEADHTEKMLSKLDQTVPQLIQQELKSSVQRYSHNLLQGRVRFGNCRKEYSTTLTLVSRNLSGKTLRRHSDLPIIDQQIDLMIQQGIFTLSKGHQTSNILSVKKKDNSVCCMFGFETTPSNKWTRLLPEITQLHEEIIKETIIYMEADGSLFTGNPGSSRSRANPSKYYSPGTVLRLIVTDVYISSFFLRTPVNNCPSSN